MKIATWNVNSVRVRIEILKNWLVENDIDVLLLQEIKCVNEAFPLEEFTNLGYNCLVSGQKSYNGVAILSKHPIESEEDKIMKSDPQARYLECIINAENKIYRLATVYVPNGNSKEGEECERKRDIVGIENTPRFKYKLDFYDELANRLKKLSKVKDEIIVFGGDYNVMFDDIDTYDAKKWQGSIAFLPSERKKLGDLFNIGFVDAYRTLHSDKQEFTWWDYRHDSLNKNRGLRIDYMLCNDLAMQDIKDCWHDKSVRSLERPSDHIPVVIEL